MSLTKISGRLRPGFLTLILFLLVSGCSNVSNVEKEDARPDELRIMSFNIHHGEGIDGVLDLQRIARVITTANADVVALQEVDRGVERSQKLDVIKELSTLTGLKYFAFGKNIDHQGGDYGNGMLSRYPIVREKNTHLRQIAPGEQRGVLQTLIDLGENEIYVVSTHLDVRNEAERLLSVRQINEEILPTFGDTTLIVAGDMNANVGSEVHKQLKLHMLDAWEQIGVGPGFTIPVETPTRRIDYILYRGSLTPTSASVVRTQASDHLPVVVGFKRDASLK